MRPSPHGLSPRGLSPHERLPHWLLAFHRANVAGVYACFFGFEEAAEDLPERVLGSDATNSNDDGVAIGPSSRLHFTHKLAHTPGGLGVAPLAQRDADVAHWRRHCKSQRSAVGDQRSAVSGQQSAVSHQRSAISDQLRLPEVTGDSIRPGRRPADG